MAVATFDTLKFANTLKTAGVPAQQAEAQAVAFAEVIQGNFKELTTKEDLAQTKSELKQDLSQVKSELKQEMEACEHRLNTRIDLLAAEIKNLRTEFRGEMTLLKWMFGVGVTVGVGILIRLFLFRGPI
jgi:ABC-type phosphate transport system auxiliary subunit